MGRKQFRQDLSLAISNPPSQVRNVRTLDDGEINFDYLFNSTNKRKCLELALLALNVDEYPHDNEYMLFVKEGDVPPNLADSLELLPTLISHQTISDALQEIHNTLQQVVTSGKAMLSTVPAQKHEQEMLEPEADDMNEDWDHDDDFDDFGLRGSSYLPITSNSVLAKESPASVRLSKIRKDLRVAKAAGFKVGVYGDLFTTGMACISIRCAKLGISEEVMQAWSLKPAQYFVLLVRFQQGFPDLSMIVEQERPSPSRSWSIQVGLCSSYKPSVESAIEVFPDSGEAPPIGDFQGKSKLEPLFIGNSVNDLFYRHFARIVKFRSAYNLGWSGAQELAFDSQGSSFAIQDMKKYGLMHEECGRALPSIVLQDSLSEANLDLKQSSFPLVAMQFALRHLVRCTEFCLVCFRSLGSTFEALKPYVCSNPLCLYHHMKLGFGPSIEWEILTQPYVVDLLISFCYVRAQAGRMNDFPIGINLRVPILPSYSSIPAFSTAVIGHTTRTPTESDMKARHAAMECFGVMYNVANKTVTVNPPDTYHRMGLRKGDFIALVDNPIANVFSGVVYHQIRDVSLPELALGDPIHVGGEIRESFRAKPNKPVKVECHAFNHNFDDLPEDRKCKSIVALLDSLPSVQEMRQYLLQQAAGPNTSLRHWQSRVSTSALDILRWIIASNRSCIVQVDDILEGDGHRPKNGFGSSEDRLVGMDGYMQFRFAQGAPDKEKRFLDCVKEQTGGHPYPTIFAWHGSPVYNWHSIIRSGLKFADIRADHGRSFGHGVYMSPSAGTSIGYVNGQSFSGWPNSELKINSALSLNEVVNNTNAFVSRSPHYVVDKTDWIQTRYLLVKTNTPHSKQTSTGVIQYLPQDPMHAPKGITNKDLLIPVTAVSKSRRPADAQVPKKRKAPPSGRSVDDCIIIDDDDDVSVATMDEDREWLMEEEADLDETTGTPITITSDIEMDMDYEPSPKKRPRYSELLNQLELVSGCLLDKTKTTFEPRSLDLAGIQRLPPPKDASRTASGALLKAFNTLLKTQRTTAAHELGWYINPDEVENMYQWVIELHSFDKDLPLAEDMKQARIKSVVLEMRFTNDYPYTPPFVRVIRPRFLPFASGGGGNVLAGGAICMELLTNTGWTAVSTIESVLLQVHLAMSDSERPARLALRGRGASSDSYTVGEAIDAYERACRGHGWQIPPAFKNLQR